MSSRTKGLRRASAGRVSVSSRNNKKEVGRCLGSHTMTCREDSSRGVMADSTSRSRGRIAYFFRQASHRSIRPPPPTPASAMNMSFHIPVFQTSVVQLLLDPKRREERSMTMSLLVGLLSSKPHPPVALTLSHVGQLDYHSHAHEKTCEEEESTHCVVFFGFNVRPYRLSRLGLARASTSDRTRKRHETHESHFFPVRKADTPAAGRGGIGCATGYCNK